MGVISKYIEGESFGLISHCSGNNPCRVASSGADEYFSAASPKWCLNDSFCSVINMPKVLSVLQKENIVFDGFFFFRK